MDFKKTTFGFFVLLFIGTISYFVGRATMYLLENLTLKNLVYLALIQTGIISLIGLIIVCEGVGDFSIKTLKRFVMGYTNKSDSIVGRW